MDKIDEIRARKLQEIVEQQTQQNAAQAENDAQFAQEVANLEAQIKRMMTKDAVQRYGTLKTAHPEKAVKVLVIIGRMVEKGQLTVIDDEALKALLRQMEAPRRDISIRRK
ncbi:MAG: DNA-binding protein [archaeon]